MNTETRIDQARWWALTHEPFYGQLCSKLGDVITTAVETAATNGRVIKWSPGYVESISDPQVRFVLLHETLHCAHLHMWRLPADDLGNEAGDYAINLVLDALCRKYPGQLQMPDGALCDPQYADMAEEDILAALKSRQQPPPQEQEQGEGDSDEEQDDDGESASGSDESDDGQDDGGAIANYPGDGKGDGQFEVGEDDDAQGAAAADQDGEGDGKGDPCGSFSEPEPDDAGTDPSEAAAESQDLREDWASSVIQAAQAAQALGQGDIPSDMERLLDRLRAQPIDWRQEMADFVKAAQSTRPDWTRPARRHAWQSVIYPRRIADAVGKVVFARDTSGSVSDKIAAQFTAVITDCLAEVGCEGLVIDCDRSIQAEYEVSQFDECPQRAQGGGGTDFRPVFDRAEELAAMGEQIAGVIYLTDLQGPSPESSDIPTLWIEKPNAYSGYYERPAFGRVVTIQE